MAILSVLLKVATAGQAQGFPEKWKDANHQNVSGLARNSIFWRVHNLQEHPNTQALQSERKMFGALKIPLFHPLDWLANRYPYDGFFKKNLEWPTTTLILNASSAARFSLSPRHWKGVEEGIKRPIPSDVNAKGMIGHALSVPGIRKGAKVNKVNKEKIRRSLRFNNIWWQLRDHV